MKKLYFLVTVFLTVSFFAKAQMATNPGICMVTVDDSSKHNIIYYDKTQLNPTDSIILWRQNAYTGGYDRVMANSQTAFSMFLDMDTAGNPNKMLHRYKLQVWTPGNGYSVMGLYHATIYCAQTVTNYNWNSYDIQGTGGGMVTEYMLLRDDNSTNQWHVIDSVSGTVNTTTDPAVLSYPNGQWRLVTKWSISCTPAARYGNSETQTSIVKSKSNITNNRSAAISTFKTSGIKLYPNPASDKVVLRLNFPLAQGTTIKLYNMLGSEVMQVVLPAGQDELEINVSALPKGIYVAEIINASVKINKQLAIE
ncbi:MAG TPA: T9SS type A sorting domain-containing protein [Bacteroidia bacterium]|jgi:hypothetical protein|nr:T9SS type A sorting domain-containing protein [Bacteroidia bacterium]